MGRPLVCRSGRGRIKTLQSNRTLAYAVSILIRATVLANRRRFTTDLTQVFDKTMTGHLCKLEGDSSLSSRLGLH